MSIWKWIARWWRRPALFDQELRALSAANHALRNELAKARAEREAIRREAEKLIAGALETPSSVVAAEGIRLARSEADDLRCEIEKLRGILADLLQMDGSDLAELTLEEIAAMVIEWRKAKSEEKP